MINPNLDTKALASSFKIDKRHAIENFLLPDIAERMHANPLGVEANDYENIVRT